MKITCPNHDEPLEDVTLLGKGEGSGTCPISKCSFEFTYEANPKELKFDKYGQVIPVVTVKDDGQENIQ